MQRNEEWLSLLYPEAATDIVFRWTAKKRQKMLVMVYVWMAPRLGCFSSPFSARDSFPELPHTAP